MPLVLIALAVVLVISAYQNTQGDLVSALESDVPGFAPLALAVAGTGAIGFIPKLAPFSKILVGMLFTMFVLRNWDAIQAGFLDLQGLSSGGRQTAGNPDPATQFATSAGTGAVPASTIAGTSGGSSGTSGTAVASNPAAALATLNPSQFLRSFESGFGGTGIDI